MFYKSKSFQNIRKHQFSENINFLHMQEREEYKVTKALFNFLKLYILQPKCLEEIQFLITAFRTMISHLETDLFQQKKKLKQANLQTKKEFGQNFMELYICDETERTVLLDDKKDFMGTEIKDDEDKY